MCARCVGRAAKNNTPVPGNTDLQYLYFLSFISVPPPPPAPLSLLEKASVTCTALHPGACRTELGRYLFDPSQPANPLVYPLLAALTLVTRTPEEGAQTQIACAADPSLGAGRGAGGLYYVGPKISELPSALARDSEAAGRMWAASEGFVGKFDV